MGDSRLTVVFGIHKAVYLLTIKSTLGERKPLFTPSKVLSVLLEIEPSLT